MPKFFINAENIKDETAEIYGQDAGHISRVLRMACSDKLTVCDGLGYDYSAKITDIFKEKVVLKLTDKRKCLAESAISVTLFQCLPKASKMDLIIEKCTELGATAVVPVASSRCVSKIEDAKSEAKKIEKWQKCADEAAKQCQRGVIPTVKSLVTLKDASKNLSDFDLVILAYELEDKTSLKSVLCENKDAKKIAIFIGPEGGFAEEEVSALKQNGAKSITLGKRILRTETAGLCVLSAVMYELCGF